MPKLPSKDSILNHKAFKSISHLMHDSHFWHFESRRAVSIGIFIGVFMSFMPMPFQMVPAVFFGVIFRANLIMSAALCWISNPITMPPILYGCYRLGILILKQAPKGFPKSFSVLQLTDLLSHSWKPLLVGCISAGLVCAAAFSIITFAFWGLFQKRKGQK